MKTWGQERGNLSVPFPPTSLLHLKKKNVALRWWNNEVLQSSKGLLSTRKRQNVTIYFPSHWKVTQNQFKYNNKDGHHLAKGDDHPSREGQEQVHPTLRGKPSTATWRHHEKTPSVMCHFQCHQLCLVPHGSHHHHSQNQFPSLEKETRNTCSALCCVSWAF